MRPTIARVERRDRFFARVHERTHLNARANFLARVRAHSFRVIYALTHHTHLHIHTRARVRPSHRSEPSQNLAQPRLSHPPPRQFSTPDKRPCTPSRLTAPWLRSPTLARALPRRLVPRKRPLGTNNPLALVGLISSLRPPVSSVALPALCSPPNLAQHPRSGAALAALVIAFDVATFLFQSST